MSNQDNAKQAIYNAVEEMAKKSVAMGGTSGSAMLRDAAIAWRAMAGGPQPGSVVVEK